MGAHLAMVGLLGSAVDSVQRFVDALFGVYYVALLAYILTSWIRVPVSLVRVQRFLYDVSDPYLRIFRRILPSFGPLDLSPLVGMIALGVLHVVVLKILDQLR